MATKPTLATLKSFIRKNREALLVRRESKFDGMTDSVEQTGHKLFTPAVDALPGCIENTLGIEGVWVVRGSNDRISRFEDGQLEGFSVYNCCGSFTVAVMKEA